MRFTVSSNNASNALGNDVLHLARVSVLPRGDLVHFLASHAAPVWIGFIVCDHVVHIFKASDNHY